MTENVLQGFDRNGVWRAQSSSKIRYLQHSVAVRCELERGRVEISLEIYERRICV